ncbi:hypothetical protein JM83_2950 [Gillisia sp. Hel_I_86]|nr:hypothetical protein [Gillisia sp. Hel_I_86]TVZ27879.1 hypothetical protein JM83_2950 [Gillisia sp. Hel_I_86]
MPKANFLKNMEKDKGKSLSKTYITQLKTDQYHTPGLTLREIRE